MAALGLAGCGQAPETPQSTVSGFPVTVSSCGQEVTIEEPPTKILTHREMSTLVAASGAADKIVARAGEAGVPLGPYADSLGDVPQINENDMSEPSREVILGEEADLVIAGRVQSDYIANLEQVGVKVLVPPWFCSQVTSDNDDAESVSFDDLYATIDAYGQAFGTQKTATRTVDDLRERVTAVEQEMGTSPARTVVNVWLGSDTVTSIYGELSINNTIMNTLGLTNMFGDMKARNPKVSFEAILGKDPDMVIVSYLPSQGYDDAGAIRAFKKIRGAEQLTAVRDDNVFAINSAYLAGGPLAVDGLEMLARRLSKQD